jgi:O-Antigen ligase
VTVSDAPAAARRRPAALRAVDRATLPDDMRAALAGGLAVFLMIFWSVDDGGTDAGIWYWGALLVLAGVAALLVLTRGALSGLPRAAQIALGCFALYVAWSYLSMTWAPYAGLALQGANRALLYLLMFTLLAAVPWRRRTALIVLGAYGAGIGVIAIAFLYRFAVGDNVPGLFLDGRLDSPTGYFNSNAALFTIGALVAIGLAARRGMPSGLRGLYTAFAAADLMLAFTPQSRGWLFTLPIVGLFAALAAGERLRGIAIAIVAALGLLVDIRPLLHLFQVASSRQLTENAIHAGKIGLLSCAGVFAVVTLLAMIESARGRGPLPAGVRRLLGAGAVVVALVAMGAGLWVVSQHHPASFISREWRGFTSEPTDTATSNHFLEVGSGRYDIWRSAVDAFRAHPLGGLGQDNFGDWYLTHRHTVEEPLWPHSLELRLLASTGIIGFLLFAAFLVAALIAALAARRRGIEGDRMLVGTALLPLGVWLIHGSIDWFWEFPALSGPALGFFAMAIGNRARSNQSPAAAAGASASEDAGSGEPGSGAGVPRDAAPAKVTPRQRRVPAPVAGVAGVLALGAATVALGFPYLAVRELNIGIGQSHTSVSASLADFRSSHTLNPLMSDPGTLGGSVALVNGRYSQAAAFYRQATSLEPGDWIAWLGRGLAASMQGQVSQARASYQVAMRLDHDQLAVRDAWKRVGTQHPLTPAEAFDEINYVP